MKKNLFLVTAFIAAITGSAQKPYKYYTESYNGTSWDSVYVNTYTYNAQWHTIGDDEVDFDGTSWVNFSQNTYSNTASGSPTLQLGKEWNTGTSTWENSSRTATTYTASKPLSITTETWNGTSYDLSNRQSNTYDANLFLTSTLYEDWDGTSWQNSLLMSFTNSPNGAPVNLLQQQWNNGTSTWDNYFRGTMTNTLTSPLTGIYEYWDGTSWVQIFQYINNYDSNLMLSTQLFQIYMGTWQNSSMTTYSYDAHNNNTLTLSESWDNQASDWMPASRTTGYYYATQAAVQTLTINNITQVSAVADASVIADGGTSVTRGICYNYSPGPLVSDMNVASGTGKGPYTASLTGLTPNTTYYVRAYATNSVGTVYGEELSFTTDLDVGFDATQLNGKFRVYPQPAGDVLNIQSLEPASCLMYDISGRPVQEINVLSGTTSIDVSKLAPGVYFLGEKTKGVKFIKQ